MESRFFQTKSNVGKLLYTPDSGFGSICTTEQKYIFIRLNKGPVHRLGTRKKTDTWQT